MIVFVSGDFPTISYVFFTHASLAVPVSSREQLVQQRWTYLVAWHKQKLNNLFKLKLRCEWCGCVTVYWVCQWALSLGYVSQMLVVMKQDIKESKDQGQYACFHGWLINICEQTSVPPNKLNSSELLIMYLCCKIKINKMPFMCHLQKFCERPICVFVKGC